MDKLEGDRGYDIWPAVRRLDYAAEWRSFEEYASHAAKMLRTSNHQPYRVQRLNSLNKALSSVDLGIRRNIRLYPEFTTPTLAMMESREMIEDYIAAEMASRQKATRISKAIDATGVKKLRLKL